MKTKLEMLCKKITEESQEILKKENLGCQANLDNAVSHYHPARKYTRVDIGGSGRYMIVNDTGEIYGIKAYGVINKGHYFGTLDTINDYNWGRYTATRIR